MKKSVFSLLLIVFTLLLPVSIAAGGQQSASDKGDQGVVEFDFWTTQTQSDRLATIQVLIDTYTTLYPNVKINLVPVDENDMVSNVQTASMSGSLPAMIEGSADMHVSFGAEGVVDTAATTALIEKVGKSDFYAGPLKMLESSQGGSYYGVPYHGWIQGIWYRADWFEEAGLEPPVTWENILKAAEHFYKPAENQYGILVGTKAETYAEQCFTPFAMSNNAGLFDKDGNLVFNSPEMKEAVEFYARLAEYNPPGPQTWRARDYYLQGKMAMFFYSTYIMDDLALAEVAQGSLTSENFENLKGASFDPDLVKNTRMAPIVSHKSDAGYGTVVAFSFLNQEDKRVTEAASRFVEYLFTQNAYITWLHMAPGGMNPMLKGIAENARFQNDPNGIFKNYGPEKMAEIIDGLNNIESFGIVEGNVIEAASSITAQQIIPKMIYSITQEGVSVDNAMNEAEMEMKKLLQ
ncbi:ABC transporter substrate-binding protein [Spirochaeta isovalerica]|uniref:Multiple sugar transport system substrate-binding protein n=1 Tax=Spirochaeta isovalerica TaxID=150 RepID=A0A841R6Q0_9SPIO|nr:extracellular solute-binding protein [Spirochaeta isovalerica]MBB6478867.1 multiple sugar transport system substrate-binding protein [Spirochaeta isovalerica]